MKRTEEIVTFSMLLEVVEAAVVVTVTLEAVVAFWSKICPYSAGAVSQIPCVVIGKLRLVL